MARIARIVIPKSAHLICQVGLSNQSIFQSKEDRLDYLRLLSEVGREAGLEFLSYCLLDNQVYLLVIPKSKKSMARGIGETHRRYTQLSNKRRKEKGNLFRGRFYSCPLDKKSTIAAISLIERFPVHQGLAKKPWAYTWSSAKFRVGLKKKDPLLEAITGIGDIDNPKELLNHDPDEMNLLLKKLKTGRPCGDKRFVARVEKLTGKTFTSRSAGRPKEDAKVKPISFVKSPAKKKNPKKREKASAKTTVNKKVIVKKGAKKTPVRVATKKAVKVKKVTKPKKAVKSQVKKTVAPKKKVVPTKKRAVVKKTAPAKRAVKGKKGPVKRGRPAKGK